MLPLADITQTPVGTVEQSALLGVVAITALPDRPVVAGPVQAAWQAAGLPNRDMPQGRKPISVFQEACAQQRTKKSRDSGKRTEVQADQVFHEAGRCVYQITRMVRDKDERVIEHERQMRATFTDGSPATLHFDRFDNDPALGSVEAEIRSYFQAHQDTLSGQSIRAAVRAVLKEAGAVNMRPPQGGVYFIPLQKLDIIEGLQAVVAAADGGESSYVHTLPVLNTQAQRDLVRDRFATSVQADATQLISEIGERLSKKTRLTKAWVRATLVSQRQLREAASNYKESLGEELSMVDLKLDVLQTQMKELTSRLDTVE